MSVTFSVTSPLDIDTVPIRLACGCDGAATVTLDTVSEISAFLVQWRSNPVPFEGCTEEMCLLYSPEVTILDGTQDLPDVNVANGNAVDILAALGFERKLWDGELVGGENAANLIERIARWNAEQDENDGANRAHNYTYLSFRMEEIEQVAHAALKMDVDVQWS